MKSIGEIIDQLQSEYEDKGLSLSSFTLVNDKLYLIFGKINFVVYDLSLDVKICIIPNIKEINKRITKFTSICNVTINVDFDFPDTLFLVGDTLFYKNIVMSKKVTSKIIDEEFHIYFELINKEWNVTPVLEGWATGSERLSNNVRNASQEYKFGHYSSITDKKNIPKDIKMISLKLNSGDSVFIPKGWWHWFVTEPGTVATNQWFCEKRADLHCQDTIYKNFTSSFIKNNISEENVILKECIEQGVPLILRNFQSTKKEYTINKLSLDELRSLTSYFSHLKSGNCKDIRTNDPDEGEKGYISSVNHLNKWMEDGEYFKQYTELKQFLSDHMPKNIVDRNVVDNNLWFHEGSESIDTGLHYDDYHGIQNVFRGRKTLLLINPKYSQLLSPLTVTDSIRKWVLPEEETSYIINNGLWIRPNMFQHIDNPTDKTALPGSVVLYWSLKSHNMPSIAHSHIRELQVTNGTGRTVWSLKHNQMNNQENWEYYHYHLNPFRKNISDVTKESTATFEDIKRVNDKYIKTYPVPKMEQDMFVLSNDVYENSYTSESIIEYNTYHNDVNELEDKYKKYITDGRFGICCGHYENEIKVDQLFYISEPVNINYVKEVLTIFQTENDEWIDKWVDDEELCKMAQGICVFKKFKRECVSIFFHTIYIDEIIKFMVRFNYNKDLLRMMISNKSLLTLIPFDACMDLSKGKVIRTAIYSTF